MKIKSARRIAPELSRCIEVDSPDRLFASGGVNGTAVLSHNSVAQRNIVFGCILRPESWRFLGIDLKRVELSVYRSYSNVVLGIATTLEDAITVLRFAQQTMMKRYTELEALGLNNFLDLPNKGQALMIMVDEAGELLGSSGVKALAGSTYIPNLSGRRNISEIQIGDVVFDNKGRFTQVLDKYTPQEQEQFDLTIKNAQSVSSGKLGKEVIRTGADHYWVVVCPDDSHSKEHIITTRDLLSELQLTAPGKYWKIKRLYSGVHNNPQHLLVDPYIFGQYLAGKAELSEDDLAKIAARDDSVTTIPDRYVYSSVDQRLELLYGIFKSGDFVTEDLYLVQDIQRVLSSMGFTAVLESVGAGIRITYSEDEPDEWFEVESIEPIEAESELQQMYCLRVSSEDSQFLCTENFIATHNTDEGKEQDMLKGEASMIIGSVARLGRAAGVHLIIATQRPDATLIPGETKANLGVRLNCGRTDSNASSMILGTGEGTRVRANPRGRLYLSIYGRGDHGQGFFAQQNWIDEYLASNGLNPDGTPLSKKQSRLATVRDMSEFGEGADLDAREGIDNSSVIEQIRQEEEAGISSSATESDDDWGFNELEDEESTQAQEGDSEPAARTDNWGALELGKGANDKNHRPEDDWDDELDDIINGNFEK